MISISDITKMWSEDATLTSASPGWAKLFENTVTVERLAEKFVLATLPVPLTEEVHTRYVFVATDLGEFSIRVILDCRPMYVINKVVSMMPSKVDDNLKEKERISKEEKKAKKALDAKNKDTKSLVDRWTRKP